jgi:hypothetical protein
MEYSSAAPVTSRAQTGFVETPIRTEPRVHNEAHASGVSWAAVIAGAFVSAALAVILLSLGTGLGLSSVSPWSGAGASAAAVTAGAIIWLILMQAISCSMGGYLAGRLRIRWASIHTDEVYFRDTAHGFLVWAVGLVITASFLATAAASMMGGSPNANAATVSRAGESAMGADAQDHSANAYFVDSLMRAKPTSSERNDVSLRTEVGIIFTNALRQGSIPPKDRPYLAQLVAARTGVSESEADRRVSDTFVEAQVAADTARKALAHLSLWLFAALLIGAFCASFSATIGGRQRDHVKLV